MSSELISVEVSLQKALDDSTGNISYIEKLNAIEAYITIVTKLLPVETTTTRASYANNESIISDAIFAIRSEIVPFRRLDENFANLNMAEKKLLSVVTALIILQKQLSARPQELIAI